MSNHQKFIDTALRLIAKHGRDTMFNTVSSTLKNPEKPWQGTAAADTVVGPFKAVYVPFRGFEFGSEFKDSQLFKEVEEICLVAGSQADLEKVDKIVDDGASYKVEWVQRLRPGNQTILYAMGVSR